MRKLKRLLSAMATALLVSVSAFSQQVTLKGTVTSSIDNAPLPGVTITIKGSKRGTVTDADGHFSISANKGDVLQFSYLGSRTQEVRVGDNPTINVRLTAAEKVLDEVVVAMDLKRNPRELGYSVQKVTGKEIAETQRENFVNSLQGRVAGLTIIPTNGQAGASSSIILRGFNSLSLSNQPLFIVDGVILDNSTMNETSNGGTQLGLASDRPNRNNDYNNRIGDLNPNDTESVTVLKGPEATALYGSQASSGAIVITTKKAVPGRMGVTYDNSFRFSKYTSFAHLNNLFGPGSNGVRGTTNFSYWGPAYPSNNPNYNNIGNFFRTGFAQTHNIGADWGKKNVGFRFSTSYFDQEGAVPTNDFRKINLRLANTTKIGK